MQQLKLSTLSASNIEEISSTKNEPSWLKEYRRNSFSVYQDLPPEVSPLYKKYSDANRMDPDQVILSLSSDKSVPDFLKERLSEIKDSISIVQIGSNVQQINVPEDLKSKGLVISSIDEAMKDHSEIIRKYLEKTDPKEDKYTALNNAFFNTGVFIHVPKNLTLDKTIHIVSSLPLDGNSVISRNVLVCEESSKVRIVQELYAPKATKQQAYLELLNVDVGPNSELEMTTLQAMDQNAINFSTRRSDVRQDSKIHWYLGLFGALLSRYKIDNYLIGTGASVSDSEVIFGNKNQSFDITSNMHHIAPSTIGHVNEKSVLKDTAKSLFKGMIRIHEKATHSQSFLSGRSILLDKGTKSDSIPGLEIFTNDVKATHAASVSQLDEEQIFYLGTRCLDKGEAERIIVEGFLEPLSRKMSFQVRAWIAYLIECKWLGRDLTIKSDEQLNAIVEVEQARYRETDQLETHYKYR